MKTMHKLTLILLMLPALSFAGIVRGKYTREKKIEKSFSVNNNAALQVMNKYGNVTITTWDQDKTELEVSITVSGNDEERVQKRFNSIEVNISGTSSLVEAYTRFGSFNRGNVSMEINYVIKIPRNGALGIGNMYGDIRLGKIYGGTNIQIQYGNLSIDEANSENNKLDLQYSTSSRIGTIKAGTIKMQYSNVDGGRAGKLTINNDYSNVKFTDADDLNMTMDYGNLSLGSVDKLVVEGDYSNLKCDRVTNLLTASLDYGSVKINNIVPAVRNIAITAQYSDIKLGFNPDMGFSFEIDTRYGSISGKDIMNFSEKIEKNQSFHCKGVSDKGAGNCKVRVNVEYGGVKLYRN
jgi:hypothetical protein